MKGKKTILTAEQRAWMVENFADTPNAKCCEQLGVSMRTIARLARELGLWKSSDFMKRAQANAAEHASKANAGEGNAGIINLLKYGKRFQYRPGHNPRGTMDEQQWQDMHARKGKALSHTYAKERRRVLFGLEQRTNLNVTREPRCVTSIRHSLKLRGYEVQRGSRIATITMMTTRSQRVEQNATKMHFRFIEQHN